MQRSLEQRFWEKVDKSGDCWEWQDACNGRGYGEFKSNGMNKYAHRICWELTYGPIPDGLWVLHHCDNKPCVNPEHLYLGTHNDNMADMVKRGRSTHGEANGNSKLKVAEVLTIRELASRGTNKNFLAGLFGVSAQQVNRIILRKQWGRA